MPLCQSIITALPRFDSLEESSQQYVNRVTDILCNAKKELKENGTLWLYVKNNSGCISVKERIERQKIQSKVISKLQDSITCGRIKNETDKAWLAALVDGEGCIYIHTQKSKHGMNPGFASRLKITMCDTQCVERASEIAGIGGRSPYRHPPSHKYKRPSCEWVITGINAASVLADIYDYLLVKKRQAIVAWNLEQIRERMPMGGRRNVHPDALRLREICLGVGRALNQRQIVKIPDWMEEPIVKTETGWMLQKEIVYVNRNRELDRDAGWSLVTHDKILIFSKNHKFSLNNKASWNRIGEQDGSVWNSEITENEIGNEEIPKDVIERCIALGTTDGDFIYDPFSLTKMQNKSFASEFL